MSDGMFVEIELTYHSGKLDNLETAAMFGWKTFFIHPNHENYPNH